MKKKGNSWRWRPNPWTHILKKHATSCRYFKFLQSSVAALWKHRFQPKGGENVENAKILFLLWEELKHNQVNQCERRSKPELQVILKTFPRYNQTKEKATKKHKQHHNKLIQRLFISETLILQSLQMFFPYFYTLQRQWHLRCKQWYFFCKIIGLQKNIFQQCEAPPPSWAVTADGRILLLPDGGGFVHEEMTERHFWQTASILCSETFP